MKIRLLIPLLICISFAASAQEAKIQGSYFAVIVSDVEASQSWYETVLGLQEMSRSKERGRYYIVNLAGPGIFVELMQLDAASARPGGQIEGPFKVGMLVDDLTSYAAALPAVAGEPKIVYDNENDVLVLQLRDPDNNTVQVMQTVED